MFMKVDVNEGIKLVIHKGEFGRVGRIVGAG
jgi:hypothetical protein